MHKMQRWPAPDDAVHLHAIIQFSSFAAGHDEMPLKPESPDAVIVRRATSTTQIEGTAYELVKHPGRFQGSQVVFRHESFAVDENG